MPRLRTSSPAPGNRAERPKTAPLKRGGKAQGEVLPIGEVARRVGTTTRTIRYYEDIGLLGSVQRVESGRRVYTGEDIRRLKFIQRLKVMGLTLEEMRALEELYLTHRSNEKVLPQVLHLLDNHLKTIDERIEQLHTLKNDIEAYKARIKSKI